MDAVRYIQGLTVQKSASSAVVLCLGAAWLTAGCGSDTTGSAPTSVRPALSSSQAPAGRLPDTAVAVARALARAGLPLKVTVVFTEETDPNHKLGRPGEYTSKVAFADSRVKRSEVQDPKKGAVDWGGSVEVFKDNAAARRRADYIHKTLERVQFLAPEYDFVSGGVVLRVTGNLTPKQAKSYGAALHRLIG